VEGGQESREGRGEGRQEGRSNFDPDPISRQSFCVRVRAGQGGGQAAVTGECLEIPGDGDERHTPAEKGSPGEARGEPGAATPASPRGGRTHLVVENCAILVDEIHDGRRILG